jgi:hypothetical protein
MSHKTKWVFAVVFLGFSAVRVVQGEWGLAIFDAAVSLYACATLCRANSRKGDGT